MNTETTPIDGEVLDSMPAAQPVQPTSTALAPASNPFQQMAVVAMEKGAMDQFEKLLDLQLKWDAEQARKAFVAAMASFKAEPIDIRKTKAVGYSTSDGGFVGYKHATLADVVDGVVSALGKHGLSHRWDVKQESGQITVVCIVAHRDGHSESVEMFAAPDNSGKKNAIQQVASTVAYLQRYTLMSATGVAARDMDDDGVAGGAPADQPPPELITADQVKILSDLIEAYVPRPDKFMDWIRSAKDMAHVQKLEDVPAYRFETIHTQLASIRKQRNKDESNG